MYVHMYSVADDEISGKKNEKESKEHSIGVRQRAVPVAGADCKVEGRGRVEIYGVRYLVGVNLSVPGASRTE